MLARVPVGALKLTFALQLPKLVDSCKLRSEVQRVLTKARHAKQQVASSVEARAGGDERLDVLLSWCQAVCGSYGLAVANFRTSFADARGMCLLVSGQAAASEAMQYTLRAGSLTQCCPCSNLNSYQVAPNEMTLHVIHYTALPSLSAWHSVCVPACL